ncbi:hypothetical protein [Aeromonas hydrophila]|uniref:hypothetical protein n=1 Tax=Aeromonas hydrophila TaxID=644 RepID=UPI003D20966C
MSSWEGIPDDINLDDYEGFIYLIENNDPESKDYGYRYLGMKSLHTRAAITTKSSPYGPKGSKPKRPSDWETYQGSNKTVSQWKIVRKKILMFCRTPFECRYREAEMIIKSGALLKQRYKNHLLSRENIGSPSPDMKIPYERGTDLME